MADCDICGCSMNNEYNERLEIMEYWCSKHTKEEYKKWAHED